MTKLRVLHAMPGFFPAVRYGGPIETVLRLCQELTRLVDLEVMTTDADGPHALDVPIGRVVDVEGVKVRYYRCWPRNSMVFSAPLVAALHAEMPRFDIAHVTGAFVIPSTAACRAARSANRPYVVSPRGSCRTWALRQKRWKKLPYWHLVERSNLERAAAIHVTSEVEKLELEELLPGARSFLVPNGVVLPEVVPDVVRAPRRVVFLGRLHPVKALDRLLEALSRLDLMLPGVEAVFAGPDDVGEWHRLSKQLARLQPRPNIRFVGPVSGRPKSELLASAAVLVLPSHSENFGQVVVEALAHGTPVIASRQTPWGVLEDRGAGLWVPNDAASLASAMYRVLSDPDQARAMGAAGLRLAGEYAWPRVARTMADMYEQCVAKGHG